MSKIGQRKKRIRRIRNSQQLYNYSAELIIDTNQAPDITIENRKYYKNGQLLNRIIGIEIQQV